MNEISKQLFRGLINPREAFQHIATATELTVFSRFPLGIDVMQQDWDLLIILDACRADAFCEVCRRTDWLNSSNRSSVISRGGSTLEWTAQTFREKNHTEISKTHYICGNLNVEYVLDGVRTPEKQAAFSWTPTKWSTVSKKDFNEFVSVWRLRPEQSGFKQEGKDWQYPPSQTVTDHAIKIGRERQPERCIVHYMPPHAPYYDAARTERRSELTEYEQKPFRYLQEGGQRQQVWKSYSICIDRVLEEVESLLQNYNADSAVITSDHGEAFGEWSGYGHRSGTINPYVRRVPWVEITAEDTHQRDPDIQSYERVENSTEEMLNALGYR